MNSFIGCSREGKPIAAENRSVLLRNREGSDTTGCGGMFWCDTIISYLHCGSGYMTAYVYQHLQNCILIYGI